MNKKGFTLVEIMIVVLIIGLLAAIAIPNFLKARNQSIMNACIDNLRVIEGAKELYAMENDNDAPTDLATLVPAYIKHTPECRAGGAYDIGSMEEDPTCDATTEAYPHALPAGNEAAPAAGG
ncbi:MAG: prepilin-type N-terminal cleavage/methylation domain-containing protein [Kiritimatiellae bacterium]|nr:prepilin-type N-terminal cleavage/methylation domain-containing protein [Kiritimatiellia bacterium]